MGELLGEVQTKMPQQRAGQEGAIQGTMGTPEQSSRTQIYKRELSGVGH